MTLSSLSLMCTSMAPALGNHLWQSTIFAGAVALLSLSLRKYQARWRYGLWLTASGKFLIPFSLLIGMGSYLTWAVPQRGSTPDMYTTLNEMGQPFTGASVLRAPMHSVAMQPAIVHHSAVSLPSLLAVIWLCGFIAVLAYWCMQWRRISILVREAKPLRGGREVEMLRRMEQLAGLPTRIEMLLSASAMEPGIFGIVRPVLLWPEGISCRLDDPHLEAVLVHEVAHVQRRDNLTCALHMLVEAIFWFHPVVWWLERRLIEERERACDEAVLRLGNEAEVYAESILDVCKFYTESPIACMSGVTGSELKQRIVRIMTNQVALKLDLSRKLLLSAVGIAAISIPMVFGLLHIPEVRAQSTPANPARNIAATWQGTLHANGDQRFVFKITRANDGMLHAAFYNIDGAPGGIPIISTALNGSLLKLELPFGTYEGTVNADGNSIKGTWTAAPQFLSQPLNLERATQNTEWAIPQPTLHLPPMAADANPTFEVATIKPSRPDEHGPRFQFENHRFSVIHASLIDLVNFASGLQKRQILDAPDWVASERYDISAVSDGEGEPSIKQWQSMVKKLMADRFQLKSHYEKRDLPVYLLTVAKSGPKLKRSDLNERAGMGGGPGNLGATNATMADIAELLGHGFLDRPVVDQTGLTGKFDLRLSWTPDEMQSATQSAGAPPDIFTAIQEQLGLKLEATKAPADVLIIDHVEKPSAN